MFFKKDQFYEAWWFLYEHEFFNRNKLYSDFVESIDISVQKVNPKTCEQNGDKNDTKVELWIEVCSSDENGINTHYHEFDTGGDTYELAIINLANIFIEKKDYVNEIITLRKKGDKKCQ